MEVEFPFMDDPDFLLEKYRAKPTAYPLSPEIISLLDKIKFETGDKLI